MNKKKTKKNNQNDVATEPTIRTLCHQKSIIVAKSKDLIDAPTDDSIIEFFFPVLLDGVGITSSLQTDILLFHQGGVKAP